MCVVSSTPLSLKHASCSNNGPSNRLTAGLGYRYTAYCCTRTLGPALLYYLLYALIIRSRRPPARPSLFSHQHMIKPLQRPFYSQTHTSAFHLRRSFVLLLYGTATPAAACTDWFGLRGSHPEAQYAAIARASMAMAMHCWRVKRNFSCTLRQRSELKSWIYNMNSKKDCWEFIKIYQKVILNVCRLTSITKQTNKKYAIKKKEKTRNSNKSIVSCVPPSARPTEDMFCC